MELTESEKTDIRRKIDEIKPGDEERIRREFGEKYGKVGGALLTSKLKVIRDLALNIACLWEMLVDPDFTLPWKTKAAIIFALGYFVSPVDAVPDAIPVVGYVDDALVVAFVVHMLSEEIVRYRAFRREKGRPLPST